LTAEWEFAFGLGGWTAVDERLPDVTSLCIAVVDEAASILAVDARGRLFATRTDEASSAGAWYAVERPERVHPGPLHSIAASANGGAAWFAAAGGTTAWLAPLHSRNGRLELGPAIQLKLTT
jgi:hypothetical protein